MKFEKQIKNISLAEDKVVTTERSKDALESAKAYELEIQQKKPLTIIKLRNGVVHTTDPEKYANCESIQQFKID